MPGVLCPLSSSPLSPLELAFQTVVSAVSLETVVFGLEVITACWESSSLKYRVV